MPDVDRPLEPVSPKARRHRRPDILPLAGIPANCYNCHPRVGFTLGQYMPIPTFNETDWSPETGDADDYDRPLAVAVLGEAPNDSRFGVRTVGLMSFAPGSQP